jgi:hypothetical protein
MLGDDKLLDRSAVAQVLAFLSTGQVTAAMSHSSILKLPVAKTIGCFLLPALNKY